MKYQSMGQGAQCSYPNHDVPTKEKGLDWCKQYAQAAYYDFTYGYPKGVFSNNGGDYEKFRMYALGKQPITQYKKWLGVDAETNNTWLTVDWSVRAIVSGYRDKAISRLMQQDYDVVATPVDMLSKSESDSYYNTLKAKIAVRQLMLQANPDLANHPSLKIQTGEPMDMEELEMRFELGEQFNRSTDAELAIQLGFYENDYKSLRRAWYEDLFDFGVAGAKDSLGEDNKAKLRRVNPENVIISYCKDATFKDLVHAGEVIDVSLIELATIKDENGNPMFSEKELQEFAGSIAGKFGNPAVLGGKSSGVFKPYDKFKCKVLDMEFYTYNEHTYTDREDSLGKPVFREEESGRGDKNNPRYKRKKKQYVYKCKWIIGTEKAYDWGMCYNQKRSEDVSKKAKAKLSYHFCSYNFYEMKAQSIMSKLIPYCDEYQLTILKIQNFKNRAVPSGWWIDLDALENVALSKGGADMQPKELLSMFFDTGVLVGRSVDAANNPRSPNWKPVIPIENTAASELQMFYQDLLNTVMTIEKMTGYNDITSGNPNPKTLVPGYQIAQQATSDALYPLAFAEEHISLCLADATLKRMQQGIRRGKVSGYVPYSKALNGATIKFIELDEGILRDYGIQLEKRTTENERMWLLQQMNADIVIGFLSSVDAVMLVNTHNVKQAMSIWAYRVKKAKEQQQQYELQKIQSNNEGQMQTTQMAAQLEQQKMQMEQQFELQKKQMEIQGELEKEKMKIQADLSIKQMEMQIKYQMNSDLVFGKEKVAEITGNAKVTSQQIANDGKHVSDIIQGQANITKQEISNITKDKKKEEK
jgi:hypothetical protein